MSTTPTREPEIVTATALSSQRGRLQRAAIGWSRRPLVNGGIPGRWGRKKRWNFWAVYGPTHIFAAAIADADYLGTVFAYVIDRRSGHVHFADTLHPLAAGLCLANTPEAPASARMGSRTLKFCPDGANTEITLNWPGFAGADLTGTLRITPPAGHESLNVVIPWSNALFHVTSKQVALPAAGELRLRDAIIAFPAGETWASFDFGRGVWPYASSWNWCTANGRTTAGQPLGINLGARWTDGTGITENGFVLDGKAHKLGVAATFAYDAACLEQPWRIVTADGSVDMIFTPQHRVDIVVQAVVLRFRIHQLLGSYQGSVVDAVGKRHEFDGLTGIAEDHYARW